MILAHRFIGGFGSLPPFFVPEGRSICGLRGTAGRRTICSQRHPPGFYFTVGAGYIHTWAHVRDETITSPPAPLLEGEGGTMFPNTVDLRKPWGKLKFALLN